MNDVAQIINGSIETLAEKKQWMKDQGDAIKAASKTCGVDKKVLRRVKDYTFYHGKGLESGNFLETDPQAALKDKITPTMKKLFTIIDDLAQVGQLELLKDYTEALAQVGIHLTFEYYTPEVKTSDKSISDNAIKTACSIQDQIIKCQDKINDEDSFVAEAEGFGPKTEYTKLINLAYAKNKKNKDIEDKVQEKVTALHTAQESYLYVQHN